MREATKEELVERIEELEKYKDELQEEYDFVMSYLIKHSDPSVVDFIKKALDAFEKDQGE